VYSSNVVPLRYVDRVLALAKENGIPAQCGATGGANDGAVFLPVWIGGCGAGLARCAIRIRPGK
jgi:hypothetical protein